jgi:peroxiredoxin
MRLKPIIFFLIVGSLAGFFVYREVTRVGDPGLINIGQQAPDFTLKGEDGRPIKLSDYRGKLVFLNFWATWCLPCVEEMPEMEKLNKTFKDRKFQMLAVSVDTDWDVVKQFYKAHNLTIPAALDPGHQISGLYKVFKFPETFLMVGALGESTRHVSRRLSDSAAGSKAEHRKPASRALVWAPLPGAAVQFHEILFRLRKV